MSAGNAPGNRGPDLAAAIAARHGLRPSTVTTLVGLGSVNHVFVLRSGTSASVVRFPIDPGRPETVEAEAWALTRAAAHGVPSPRVLGTGRLDGVPYLVQTFVNGARGTERRSTAVWESLGRYARAIARIPVTPDAPDGLFTRFGRDLPRAWRAHLRYNLDELVGSDPLIALGVYGPEQQAALRQVVTGLASAELAFGLTHGDLSMANVLVPEDGAPVLIDWGSAQAGPSPHDDLVTVLGRHRLQGDPSATEMAAFADGCGLGLDEFTGLVDDLTLLKSLDLVRWAIAWQPEMVRAYAENAHRYLQTHGRVT